MCSIRLRGDMSMPRRASRSHGPSRTTIALRLWGFGKDLMASRKMTSSHTRMALISSGLDISHLDQLSRDTLGIQVRSSRPRGVCHSQGSVHWFQCLQELEPILHAAAHGWLFGRWRSRSARLQAIQHLQNSKAWKSWRRRVVTGSCSKVDVVRHLCADLAGDGSRTAS